MGSAAPAGSYGQLGDGSITSKRSLRCDRQVSQAAARTAPHPTCPQLPGTSFACPQALGERLRYAPPFTTLPTTVRRRRVFLLTIAI